MCNLFGVCVVLFCVYDSFWCGVFVLCVCENFGLCVYVCVQDNFGISLQFIFCCVPVYFLVHYEFFLCAHQFFGALRILLCVRTI